MMELSEINEFTKYTKFSSPFVKDEKYLNIDELSQELPIGNWIKTEKIDGTNIRIILTKPDEEGNREILIGSRKLILNKEDKGSRQYLDCLKEVNLNKIKEYFEEIKSTVVIYGEGYGAGVQRGGIYAKDKNYRVFDIRIGLAYQDFEYVKKVCIDNQLNIVPIFSNVDEITYQECLESLRHFDGTLINEGCGGVPEGLVYKFEPVLLNKYGERLIFKIKRKDFKEFKKGYDVLLVNSAPEVKL